MFHRLNHSAKVATPIFLECVVDARCTNSALENALQAFQNQCFGSEEKIFANCLLSKPVWNFREWCENPKSGREGYGSARRKKLNAFRKFQKALKKIENALQISDKTWMNFRALIG